MNIDPLWWITVVDLPAMAGLFWLIWRTRRDAEDENDRIRDILASYKLDVAERYAQNSDLQALEKRLTSHLLRIEAKLDVTALKAEALQARTK